MGNVVNIYPANDFKVVCDEAAKEITCGIIIGYDNENLVLTYCGGLIDGKQPVAKDWLWLIEEFKHHLMSGDYFE